MRNAKGRTRLVLVLLLHLLLLSEAGTAQTRRGGAAATPAGRSRPTVTPVPRPTPVPPERIERVQRGGATRERVARFASPLVSFSRLVRVEEVDLDRDGVVEALVDGVGTVGQLPTDIPAIGFMSNRRLPFESPLLIVFQKQPQGEEWRPLLIAHIPLRCSQAGDLARCDQVMAFQSMFFRFDDRPQVLLQILRPGDTGLSETYAYRLVKGRLDPTFSSALPRHAVEVQADPNGIRRRVAVDTFVNQDLAPRYRSFTLVSTFIFGERKFRIHAEYVEKEWSERGDLDLSYWGLVHQANFAPALARLREQQRVAEASGGARVFDPAETVRRRISGARNVRLASAQPGVAIVHFRRGACDARAVLYQPLREEKGEKSFWEFASIRGSAGSPYECLEEPPVAMGR